MGPANNVLAKGEYAQYYKKSQFGSVHLPAFGGVRRKRGHGLFGRLLRSVIPIRKDIGKLAVKAVAPTLLSTGSGILSDVLGGGNFKTSLRI